MSIFLNMFCIFTHYLYITEELASYPACWAVGLHLKISTNPELLSEITHFISHSSWMFVHCPRPFHIWCIMEVEPRLIYDSNLTSSQLHFSNVPFRIWKALVLEMRSSSHSSCCSTLTVTNSNINENEIHQTSHSLRSKTASITTFRC